MKLSPIFKKDEITSVRRYFLPFLITLVNGCLAFLVLVNLFYVSKNARATGEISYINFLRIYYIAAAAELLLILLIAPALTSSSISGERERKTLGLLLTTQLDPWDIVIGKFLGALSTLFLLVITSIPILSTVYIYGGITLTEVLQYISALTVTAVFCTSVGIMGSSLVNSTAASNAISYVIIFVSYALIIVSYIFKDAMGISEARLISEVVATMLLLSAIMLYISKRQITPRRRKKSKEG
ncbi:MAG: ABC transporter permease subunit [Oribacterium sp.]|nr:ABC transporter permease subunit [Oribacterium sp.]MBO6309230.1 ABC transporter permease subunit [Oribacterium sp.]MBP3806609.1 ABC transporter permease subunit [Oribacterium sp.]